MGTTPKRVLIADDNPSLRTVIRSALEENHEVVEVDDGQGLEDSLKAHRYDLIISDLNMPKKSGVVALTRGADATSGEEVVGRGVPILIITGKDERDEDVVRARRMVNVYEVFHKPLDFEKLLTRVEEILGRGNEFPGPHQHTHKTALESLPKVLVVDDEREACDILAEILEAEGCQVRTSITCREGLELCRSTPFDLILLDYIFSDGVGEEFLRELEDRSEPGEVPPVLVVTGFADCLDKKQFHEFSSVKGVLSKPVDREELLGQASKAMGVRLPVR